MDSFIQGLKKKLSVDTLVEMMKEAEVIGEDAIKEEEVRRTLMKVDPNGLVDVDEMARQLTEISTKKPDTKTKQVMDAAKSSLNALQKLTKQAEEPEPKVEEQKEETHPYIKEDNLFNLNDDFR